MKAKKKKAVKQSKPYVNPPPTAISLQDLQLLHSLNLQISPPKHELWGVKIFKEFLSSHGHGIHFEDMSPQDLNGHLMRFYASVRRPGGLLYSKTAMTDLRQALNRHLQSPPYFRKVDIIKDKAFRLANQIFVGVLHNTKGKSGSLVHQGTLTDEEWKKMYQHALGTYNPIVLQRKVFVEIGVFLKIVVKYMLRDLNKKSFKFHKDENGVEYVTYACEGKPGFESPKMYADPGNPNCPVSSLRLYISKLHPNLDTFFQYPHLGLKMMDDPIWYEDKVLGKNQLTKLMPDISKVAGLCKIYNNGILKATQMRPVPWPVKDTPEAAAEQSAETAAAIEQVVFSTVNQMQAETGVQSLDVSDVQLQAAVQQETAKQRLLRTLELSQKIDTPGSLPQPESVTPHTVQSIPASQTNVAPENVVTVLTPHGIVKYIFKQPSSPQSTVNSAVQQTGIHQQSDQILQFVGEENQHSQVMVQHEQSIPDSTQTLTQEEQIQGHAQTSTQNAQASVIQQSQIHVSGIQAVAQQGQAVQGCTQTVQQGHILGSAHAPDEQSHSVQSSAQTISQHGQSILSSAQARFQRIQAHIVQSSNQALRVESPDVPNQDVNQSAQLLMETQPYSQGQPVQLTYHLPALSQAPNTTIFSPTLMINKKPRAAPHTQTTQSSSTPRQVSILKSAQHQTGKVSLSVRDVSQSMPEATHTETTPGVYTLQFDLKGSQIHEQVPGVARLVQADPKISGASCPIQTKRSAEEPAENQAKQPKLVGRVIKTLAKHVALSLEQKKAKNTDDTNGEGQETLRSHGQNVECETEMHASSSKEDHGNQNPSTCNNSLLRNLVREPESRVQVIKLADHLGGNKDSEQKDCMTVSSESSSEEED